ncbi:J domain-containing protein [Cerasicoccus maritimus]|uniref:J domain-containing protein n=1 Tax=Cerasicoccus maritimus TaxID=490089 RepID=UPI00285280E9|nr:J domain-containing protein [Cerasicoccus maritimus]
MIPQRDQPWFEFQLVQPDGSEFVESLPAETIREALEKMRRIYPHARLTLTRQFKKDHLFEPGSPSYSKPKPKPQPTTQAQSSQRTATPPPQPKSTPATQDFHTIFKLPADADFRAVKKAYLDALKRYHPDRVADLGEELVELAEQKTREYNEAFKAAKAHFKK